MKFQNLKKKKKQKLKSLQSKKRRTIMEKINISEVNSNIVDDAKKISLYTDSK